MPWGAFYWSLLAQAMGGIAPALTKQALSELEPATLVAAQYVLALLALIAVNLVTRRRTARTPFARGDWALLCCSAWLGLAIPGLLVAFGLERSTAVNGALLASVGPLGVALGGVFCAGERPGIGGSFALLLAALGAAAIAASSRLTPGVGDPGGDLLLVAGYLAAASYALAARPLVQRHPPERVAAWSLALALPPLLGLVVQEPPLQWPSATAGAPVAALALGSTALAGYAWNRALQTMPASALGALIFVQPVIGLLAGSLLLGEQWGKPAVAAAALVVTGVTLASLRAVPDFEPAVTNGEPHTPDAIALAPLATEAPTAGTALAAEPDHVPWDPQLEPDIPAFELETIALETSELDTRDVAEPETVSAEPRPPVVATIVEAYDCEPIAAEAIAAPTALQESEPALPEPEVALPEPQAALPEPEPAVAAPQLEATPLEVPLLESPLPEVVLAEAELEPAPVVTSEPLAATALTEAPAVQEPRVFRALHEIVLAARERLSDDLWHYLVGGSETEMTVLRNRRALDSFALRPRVLRDVSEIDPSLSLFGQRLRIPVALAPIGGLEALHPDGALASARAAAAFGTASLHSSVCAPELEATADIGSAPRIFQLFVRGDDDWIDGQVERAIACGCCAFCITVDTALFSRRERDLLTRESKPWRARADGFEHQAALSWKYVEHYKQRFTLPLLLKGIATAEDAMLACERGVDVIYVSNHGGRQLDHGRGAIAALPEVVDAVAGRAAVWVDGGFCRGTDVVKALALGAQVVGIGRLLGYGIAAAGEAGVIRVLELLESEIRVALGLLGVTRWSQLDRSYVERVETFGTPHALSAFPMLDLDVRGPR